MFLTEYDKELHLKNTFEEGREKGQRLGMNRILYLNQQLLQDNRLDDLRRASVDEQYREKLLKEFKL